MALTCARCGKKLKNEGSAACPHCGEPLARPDSGVVKTCTVLISAGSTEGVYRSVQEVPDSLRKKLLQSTNSLNSATILIADRRGREEISRAIQSLPPPKRIAGRNIPWKTWVIRSAGILLGGAAGALVWFLCTHQW